MSVATTGASAAPSPGVTKSTVLCQAVRVPSVIDFQVEVLGARSSSCWPAVGPRCSADAVRCVGLPKCERGSRWCAFGA